MQLDAGAENASHGDNRAVQRKWRTLLREVLCGGLEVARVPAPAMHHDNEALCLRARVHEEVAHVQLDAVWPLQSPHVRACRVLQ